jgi:predicted metalloendopeptidase
VALSSVPENFFARCLAAAFALTAIAACARSKKIEITSTSAIADTPENKAFGDVDRDAIDLSVSPCADFYAYACGGWMKKTRIPDDEGMWSRSFHEVRARDESMLRAILERDAVAPPADEPYSAPLGDFFASCMDETAIDARGDAELTSLLDDIDTRDADAIAKTIAHLHLLGVPALFVLEPEPDLRDANKVAAVIRQPPLTRASDPLAKELSSGLEARSVFHDASARAQVVDANGLAKIAPNFPWKTYFFALGISPPPAIHVATPNYFSTMNRVLTEIEATPTERDALRTMLRAELLHALAPTSSRAIADGDFQRARNEMGAISIAPRWKRCVRAADALLGDALAVPFARAAFGDEASARAHAITTSLISDMRAEVDSLSWMDADTRLRAQKKLATLSVSIGNPHEKPDYGALSLGRASFLANDLRVREWVAGKRLAAIGRATDRDAWRFSASTANAYFDPRKNELVIAAGILTPPIFDARDRETFAFDFIVGHELTHAIDRRFNENGNEDDWWSLQATAQFQERVACVRRDLETIAANEKIALHVNQILDESVADSGGLELAYRKMAAEHPLAASESKARDQAFFTAFAQLSCTQFRPEALATFVAENAHAPPRIRVNRAVTDRPELADAFSCKDGDAMTKLPAARCVLR